MAELVVHDLEDKVRERLEERARAHGVSTEEEIRSILRDALGSKDDSEEEGGPGSGAAFLRETREKFAPFGLDQEIPELRGYLQYTH